jgi:hypothetical protein
MKNLKIEKEVEERYNKYFSKYEKRLDEMENKLDKKVELDEVKALIQENKESAATGGNDQDGTLTSQLEEFKESMARKSNIIIFRAEESKKTEPKERKVEDIALVNELCKTIEALTSSRSTFLSSLLSFSSSRFSYLLKYLLHLSSTSFSIFRFCIAFSSQGGNTNVGHSAYLVVYPLCCLI